MRRGGGGRSAGVASALLCALPLLLTAAFASRHHFVMPFSDQWGLVPIVERAVRGELRFDDLWRQKTDHRIFFPKLVMIPLAAASGWDHGLEWKLNLACAAALFGVLAVAVRRVFRVFGAPGAALVWPALALLVFSPLQYKNWLWGLQLQIWMCALAACASAALLAARPGWGGVSAGAALAFVATHSFAVGLASWPVGAGVLALAPGVTGRGRKLAAWSAAAALGVVSFAAGFELHGAEGRAGGSAAGLLAHALTGLGQPVAAFDARLAAPAGALGVALLVGLPVWLGRLVPGRRAALAPLLGIGLLSLAAALAIGLGRSELGVGQARAARYVTWSSLLWAADAGLLGLALALGGVGSRTVLGLLAALLLGGAALGVPAGLRDGAVLSSRVRATRAAVLAAWPDVPAAALRAVTPRPDRARRMLPRLHRHRLSLFRERER